MAKEDLHPGLNLRRCVGNAMLWNALQVEISHENGIALRKENSVNMAKGRARKHCDPHKGRDSVRSWAYELEE